MTTSETSVPQTLRETMTMSSSSSSQGSQSSDNGRLTGTRVTICQLNSTCFKMSRTITNTLSRLTLCMATIRA
jgi:hypothetical protein